jgi:threonyl-tRNA synthetase
MIHRGTVGSMERVTAALLERYQGRLPLWLAPVQVCVLPVSPAQDEEARRLADSLLAAGLRARLDVDGSLGARIRHSRQRRDHLIAVLGEAEAAAGTVRVTDVGAGFAGEVAEESLVRLVAAAYAARRPRVDWPREITAV